MDQTPQYDAQNVEPVKSTRLPDPVMTPAAAPVQPSAPSVFQKIQRATAWVMILSAVAFALVGILAVWKVFGETTDIVWRALSSLAIIAFAALIINVSVRMVEERQK